MPTRIAGMTLYNLKEVADGLGVSYQTAKRWAADGKIRAARIGREYRIEESELQRLLSNNPETLAREVKTPL